MINVIEVLLFICHFKYTVVKSSKIGQSIQTARFFIAYDYSYTVQSLDSLRSVQISKDSFFLSNSWLFVAS